MPKFIWKEASAYKVEIFIGGDHGTAINTCVDYATRVGLCVTVEPTIYCYRGGYCDGVRVGLINYARFPKSQEQIWNTAVELAEHLQIALGQGSFTVQDHKQSLFYSEREEDGCSPD